MCQTILLAGQRKKIYKEYCVRARKVTCSPIFAFEIVTSGLKKIFRQPSNTFVWANFAFTDAEEKGINCFWNQNGNFMGDHCRWWKIAQSGVVFNIGFNAVLKRVLI